MYMEYLDMKHYFVSVGNKYSYRNDFFSSQFCNLDSVTFLKSYHKFGDLSSDYEG